MRISLERRQAITGYLFISPWLLGFLVFLAYPLVHSFWLSFNKMENLLNFQTSFVGWENYVRAWVIDVNFPSMFSLIVRNSILDVPLTLIFSLFTALLVNQKIRGQKAFRAIFFLPVLIVTGLVARELFFNSDVREKTIESLLTAPEIIFTYLGPDIAQFVREVMVRLTTILWHSGVQILIFIAGLQGISSTLYEAARVDGANDWEMFWKITLPMISPILLLNAVYTIVDGFTDVLNPILDYIKNLAFAGQFEMGYAAALGWIYFLFIFLLILVVVWASQKLVFYAGER